MALAHTRGVIGILFINIAWIAYDAFITLSFIHQTYCTSKVYQQDTYVKLYKLIRLFYALAIQSVYFEISSKGLYDRENKETKPLLWIIQTMYFFMCPTIFIIAVISILSCYKLDDKPITISNSTLTLTRKRALTSIKACVSYMFVFNLTIFTMVQLVLYIANNESIDNEHFNIENVAIAFIVIYAVMLVIIALMNKLFR